MFKLLITAGGVDADEAIDAGDGHKYATYGVLALLIAALAGMSTFATLAHLMKLSPVIAVPAALIIAGIVFAIDRLIIGSPLSKDTFWARLKLLLVRGSISVVLGLFISHGVVLYMLADTLEARVTTAAETRANKVGEDIKKNAPETAKAADATATIEALKRDNVRMQRITDKKFADWRNNTVCLANGRAPDGDRCGFGGIAPALEAAAKDYKRNTLIPQRQDNNTEISTLQDKIDAWEKDVETRADTAMEAERNQVGLGAQSGALIDAIKDDPSLALIPLVIMVLDMAVVFMKASSSSSNLDRRAQLAAAQHAAYVKAVGRSDAMAKALETVAGVRAEEMVAEERARAERSTLRRDRRLAQTQAREARLTAALTARGRSWTPAPVAALVLALVVGAIGAGVAFNRDDPANATSSEATSGVTSDSSEEQSEVEPVIDDAGARVMDLGDGARLRIPKGSITNDAPVEVEPASAKSWPGHESVIKAVEITTSGKVVGRPEISLKVPKDLRSSAASGTMQVGFETADGWKEVRTRYDAATGTLAAKMPHFSTWGIFNVDVAGLLSQASQSSLELIGRRAGKPECTSGAPTPKWLRDAVGVTDEPSVVIRGCTQGHKGDDVLDVQLVNNRPYGMMLSYNGAGVKWGWHEKAESIAEAMRDGIGDEAAAQAGGLYLPPLSRASVGIINPGSNAHHDYFVGPTAATMGADVVHVLADAAAGQVLPFATGARAYEQFRDVFKAAAAGKCAELASSFINNSATGNADAFKALLTGKVADCLSAVMTVVARNSLATGTATEKSLTRWSNAITAMKKAGRAGALVEGGQLVANIFEFAWDAKISLGEQGYGFRVWARAADTVDPDPTPTPTPTPPTPTTPGKTDAPEENEPKTPVVPDPTTPPPAPATSTPPSTEPTPQTGGEVVVYDNYGTVTTPGTPICRGNPDRPESMPGGTVAQTFTTTRAATLNKALVQIDPEPQVTVTATLSVNGAVRATSTSQAAGDTTFNFEPVAVPAGANVELKLALSATTGKITTMYTVGSPGGQLSVDNKCPDRAPTYTRSDTGLRAKVSGIGA